LNYPTTRHPWGEKKGGEGRVECYWHQSRSSSTIPRKEGGGKKKVVETLRIAACPSSVFSDGGGKKKGEGVEGDHAGGNDGVIA